MNDTRFLRFLRYVWHQKAGLAWLAVLSFLAYLLYLVLDDTAAESIALGFVASTLALIAFQVATEFQRIETISDVLTEHDNALLKGVIIHERHAPPLISRADAIRLYLGDNDCFRLLTTTADDYLLAGEAKEALLAKLQRGARVELLLYTPIFDLRSFLDRSYLTDGVGGDGRARLPPGSEVVESLKFHHRHASELILKQRTEIFQAIADLQSTFPGRVAARFFQTQHHISITILGEKRIFAAPLLLSKGGRDLPCLEIFPGKLDQRLFERFSNDFRYLWEKEKILFSFDEIRMIYDVIWDRYRPYFDDQLIKDEAALEIEYYAENLRRRRLEARLPTSL